MGLQSVIATSDGITVNVSSNPVIVSTGDAPDSTALNNARKLVRDKSGNIYLAYYKSDYQIYVAKSTDNGNTWSDIGGAPIQTISGYLQRYPSIAIDSQDNLHVVWWGTDSGNPSYDQIKYSTCSTNCQIPANWSAWVNKTSSTTANQLVPTLCWSRWNSNGGSLDYAWVDGTTVMFNKDENENGDASNFCKF